jgi:quinol monooxygenase YgiN
MIHVLATIETAPGKREDFLKEFLRIVDIVRDEDGCIEYGPAVDLATEFSDAPRENVVTVVEKWTNVDALKAHLRAPHVTSYRERVRDMVVAIKIQTLAPA